MGTSKRGGRDSLEELLPSWKRHLRAANYSPKTIVSYTTSAQLLAEFLSNKGVPLPVASLAPEHIQAFMEDQLARYKPTTAATHYRDLQQLFKWLIDEGEIDTSPMARMRRPPAGRATGSGNPNG